jgi:hypothetical protein
MYSKNKLDKIYFYIILKINWIRSIFSENVLELLNIVTFFVVARRRQQIVPKKIDFSMTGVNHSGSQ